MENLRLIISLAVTSISLILTIFTILAKYSKNSKLKNASQNIIKICNTILPFMKEAELFTNYSGEEKKSFVMTKINQFAIDNKLNFDKELVSMEIENLIELTKSVNKKKEEI